MSALFFWLSVILILIGAVATWGWGMIPLLTGGFILWFLYYATP